MTSFKSLKDKLIAFGSEHAYRMREDRITLLLSLVLLVVLIALTILVLEWPPKLSRGQTIVILLLVLLITILLYLLIYHTTRGSDIQIFYFNIVFTLMLYLFLLGFVTSEYFVMLVSGAVLGISEPNEKMRQEEINTQQQQKLPDNSFEPLIEIQQKVEFFLFGPDYIARTYKNSFDTWDNIQKQHEGMLSTRSMRQSDASTQSMNIVVQLPKDTTAEIISSESPQVLKIDKQPKSILKTSVIIAGEEGETITSGPKTSKRVSFELVEKEKREKELLHKSREL